MDRATNDCKKNQGVMGTDCSESPLCAFALSAPLSIHPQAQRDSVVVSALAPRRRHQSTTAAATGADNRPPIMSRRHHRRQGRRLLHVLPRCPAGGVRKRKREKSVPWSLQEVLHTLQEVYWHQYIPPPQERPTGRRDINSESNSSTSESNFSERSPFDGMDDRYRKISCVTTSELATSPVLLRRRLSAPETIMRKYVLAQQRSDSQESVSSTSIVNGPPWRSDAGSDPNLTRRRDANNAMRKSTLMRRLWGGGTNNKNSLDRGSRYSGAYSEWQYSCRKLSTHSLGSLQSSPEHGAVPNKYSPPSRRSLNGDEFNAAGGGGSNRTSPKHSVASRRISPKNQGYELNRNYVVNIGTNGMPSPKRKISVYNNGNYEDAAMMQSTRPYTNSTHHSQVTSSENTENRLSTTVTTSSMTNASKVTTTTTTTTESESECHNSTRSTNTLYSDNSDSAYTNTNSNYTQSTEPPILSNRTESNHEAAASTKADGSTPPVDTQQTSGKYETSTQTSENSTTNLNVISNIQLSQSTLDLIYSHVMQDVKSSPDLVTKNSFTPTSAVNAKVVNVQQSPSFYLNRVNEPQIKHTDHSRIIKYMISNVGAGSPYKPAEVPQLIVVPRYSALPRTSSMEVNTSSAEESCTDREDTISLVDSLEDHSSPRFNDTQVLENSGEKRTDGDLSLLLPDNSDQVREVKSAQKPTAFFVPITSPEAKSEQPKTVAEHFPNRLRDRLMKRQIKREEKRLQTKCKVLSPRSDSNYISASENGNNVQYVVNSDDLNNDVNCAPDAGFQKMKRKQRTVLPNIDSSRKVKSSTRGTTKHVPTEVVTKPISKVKTQIAKFENSENPYHIKCKESPWLARNRNKLPDKLSPINSHKNDYPFETNGKKGQNKSDAKRIEILEIMECIEPEKFSARAFASKSKIPILVHQKLPKLPQLYENRTVDKPTYLDYDEVELNDPKLDQLIANILIDTLHNPHFQNAIKLNEEKLVKKLSNVNEKRPSGAPPQAQNKFTNKYAQKFEVIPEERSFQSSTEEASAAAVGGGITKFANNNLIDKAAELLTNHVLVNNNVDQSRSVRDKQQTTDNDYQGKAAVAVVKDDNLSTLPKGWITFYTLHKSQSPDSTTSDEGVTQTATTLAAAAATKKNHTDANRTSTVARDKSGGQGHSLPPVKHRHVTYTGQSLHIENMIPERITTKTRCYNCQKYSAKNNIEEDDEQSDSQSSGYSNHSDDETALEKITYSKQNRTGNFKKQKPSQRHNEEKDGWTLTVSGTTTSNEGGPEVEMRLKFPNSTRHQHQKHSPDERQNHHNEENTHQPNRNTHTAHPSSATVYSNVLPNIRSQTSCRTSVTHHQNHEIHERGLPDIQNEGIRYNNKSRHRDATIPVAAESPARVRQQPPYQLSQPRPTKTSSRRYCLTHRSSAQRHHHHRGTGKTSIPVPTGGYEPAGETTSGELLPCSTEDERCLAEILRRFPQILSINGNGISSDRKTRVQTYNERTSRNFYTSEQY